MKTMKSGELSPALCLLIQRHMPRNVAISMITMLLLSFSLSLSLSLSQTGRVGDYVAGGE